jgi:hypothetical protein
VLTTGILHDIAINPDQITVSSDGDYLVTFSVSGAEANQFGLFVNGTTLVGGSVFGSGDVSQQNVSQVIVTLSAGDVLTVTNYTSATSVTLNPVIGGAQSTTNASIVILKLF